MDEPLNNNDTRGGPFTRSQINTIVIFERVGASLSLFGVVLILAAYSWLKKLRTVPNTFIVFASLANMGACIACLIGYSGVIAGSGTTLCQVQGFLFELFMQSDPWWSFAMAVNVYMVFFFSANPKSFLRYWWAYFVVCYGVPFVPALWLLLMRGTDGEQIYGNATIWCWIDGSWSDLRIYTYYLPIWVCIALSSIIYIAVGYFVFKQRNQLRNLTLTNPTTREVAPGRDSGEKDLFSDAASMGTVITNGVQITTVNASTTTEANIPRTSSTVNWFDGPTEDQLETGQSSQSPTYHTVTHITAEPIPRETTLQRINTGLGRWRNKFNHMDPIKLAYLRTSFVFAVSVLITWTPSSINRVRDFLNGEASFPLNLATAAVLPLQGVWNAVIFFSTSWNALSEEIRVKIDCFRGIPLGQQEAAAVRNERERERDVELQRRAARHRNSDVDSNFSTAFATSTVATKMTSPVMKKAPSGGSSTMRIMRDGSLSSL